MKSLKEKELEDPFKKKESEDPSTMVMLHLQYSF